jgi:hypothetical protein
LYLPKHLFRDRSHFYGQQQQSSNQSNAIALFPDAWAKDAIAYSEHCDRPSYTEAKSGDHPIKALRSPFE